MHIAAAAQSAPSFRSCSLGRSPCYQLLGACLHVELLALLVDAPHQRQVRLALQQQLLLLLQRQVQHLRGGRGGRSGTAAA